MVVTIISYIFSVKEEVIVDWSSCNLIKVKFYLGNEIGGIVLDELVINNNKSFLEKIN